ncbi:MAG: hypothetical protein NZ740_07070 [Kiritimatiellae bacterium]|nr:hypothetical protein [Kiritimatiellia bacterium]MDW8458859.1 hypothetical protein [Verrucomicrobiota bacterium]
MDKRRNHRLGWMALGWFALTPAERWVLGCLIAVLLVGTVSRLVHGRSPDAVADENAEWPPPAMLYEADDDE